MKINSRQVTPRPLPQLGRTFYPTCVRFPATCSRTARGRRTASSGVHQTIKTSEVSNRFGSQNGLSVSTAESVPLGPRVVDPPSAGLRCAFSVSSYSAIMLPEPGGCRHRPVPQSYGSSSRRTAGTRKSRTQTLCAQKQCWPCSDTQPEPQPDAKIRKPIPSFTSCESMQISPEVTFAAQLDTPAIPA